MKNKKFLNDYYQPNIDNDDNDIVENISTESTSDLKIGDIYFTKKGNKVIENWVMN